MSVPSRKLTKDLIQQYGRRYLQLGWSLLPMAFIKDKDSGEVTKRPVVKWKELQSRYPTQEEVENWLNKGYLLGLITGHLSNIIVVDDDRIKHDLPEYDITSAVIAKTKSGGKHYYFRYSPGITNTANHDLHVDIRGQGGYVVLPPFNGYEWISPPTEANLRALNPLPESKQLEILPASFSFESGRARPIKISDLVNLDKGSRNDSLLRLANSLCNRYPKEEWGSAVWQILIGANNSFEPPLNEKEVKVIFDQATRFVASNPARNRQERRADRAERTDPVYYSQMSSEDMKKVEKRQKMWLGIDKVDKVFSFPNGYYVICANPGAGKGWFAMWISRKAYEIHGKKSVFFSLEMPEQQVRGRLLQAWSDLTLDQFEKGADTSKAEDLMKKDVFVVYPFGEKDSAYQTPENFEKDVDKFYEQGYRVFHFDHFHELEGATSNDTNPKLAEMWAKTFQNILKTKYDDIWLFVYAQPNGAAARKSLLRRDDISGSKVITQKCEVFLSLNREVSINKETNEIEVDSENRNVTIWVDKNRVGSKQYIGTQLYFGEDGNFYESEYKSKQIRSSVPVPRPPEKKEVKKPVEETPTEEVLEAFGLEDDDAFSDF